MNDSRENTETLEPIAKAGARPDPTTRKLPPAVTPEHELQQSLRHLADDHDEDEGFFERHRGKIIAVAVLVIGGGVSYVAMNHKGAPVAKAPARQVVSIQLPPPPAPPPPPPPPPKIQPPPEQKMTEIAPVEDKPEDPKPVDEPPPSMGTGVKGNGPADGFGLSGTGNGMRIGGNGGNGGRAGSPYGRYFGQVQKRISDALGQNRKTRASRFGAVQVRIWPDVTGRITRAQLVGSTGDSAVDAAIQSDVLTGLQLHEPLPPGITPPVVLRINARRP